MTPWVERASCPFHFQAGCLNTGYEAKNEGVSFPNAPYITFTKMRCTLPSLCYLFPVTYSLLPVTF
ncbi:MAG: hypothetical protein F6K26_32805 [Moorea sp. SIO2I5]|nr:hypothetical protein [Moorena sp. SIO2I5]